DHDIALSRARGEKLNSYRGDNILEYLLSSYRNRLKGEGNGQDLNSLLEEGGTLSDYDIECALESAGRRIVAGDQTIISELKGIASYLSSDCSKISIFLNSLEN